MSPQNNNLLREGDEFEKFVIERELGHGGMGAVYLVRHRVLDSEFALKVLYPEIATRDGQFVERFIREARLAGRIHHPNLIAVYDAGYNDRSGMYYLVMDYVPGVSLRKRIKEEGCIPLPEAISIVRQCADALKAAQQYNMVHRDIKPDNIMFGSHGEARLADLGIAKASGDKEANLTLEAAVFGTPSYMSPEQARDSSQVDTRADIYSLGVVLFEMLTGTRPFKGSSTVEILANVISDQPAPLVTSVKPEIPADVAKLVADMLAKPLSERIASPAALIQRIDALDMDAIEAAAAQADEDEFATAPTMVNAAAAVAAHAPQAAPIASAVQNADGAPEVTMPTAVQQAPKASPAQQASKAKPARPVASAVQTADESPEVTMPTAVQQAKPAVQTADESPEVTMPTAAPPASKATPAPQVLQAKPAVQTADDQPQVTMDMPVASVPQTPPNSSKKGKVAVILAIVLVVVLIGIGGAVFGTMKLIANLNEQQDPNKPGSGEIVQPSPSPEKTDSPQSVQTQNPETSVTQSQTETQTVQTKTEIPKTDQQAVETKTETQVVQAQPEQQQKPEQQTVQTQPEQQQKPEQQVVQTQPEQQQKVEPQTVQTQPAQQQKVEPQTVQTQPEQQQKVEPQTVQTQPEQQQKPESQTVQAQPEQQQKPEPQTVQAQPEQQQTVQAQPEQQQKVEQQIVQTQPEPQVVQTQPEPQQKVEQQTVQTNVQPKPEPQPVQPKPVLPVNPPQPANADAYPPGNIFLFGEDNAGTRQLLAAVRAAAPGKTVTLHKAGLSSRCRGQLSGLRSQKPDLLMVAVTSRYSGMSLANFETLVNELLDDFVSQGTNFIFVLEPTAGRNSRFCSGNDVVRDACTRHGRGWLDCQADINLDISEFLKKD